MSPNDQENLKLKEQANSARYFLIEALKHLKGTETVVKRALDQLPK